MPESITCPGCGQQFVFPEGFTDGEVRCPACLTVFLATAQAASRLYPNLELEPPPQSFRGEGIAPPERSPNFQAQRPVRNAAPPTRRWLDEDEPPIAKNRPLSETTPRPRNTTLWAL